MHRKLPALVDTEAEKTADILRRHQCFPSEITFEERAQKFQTDHVSPGADPRFFLGGGALVSYSTSTPINHIVQFFFGRIPVVLENRWSSQGGGGGAHPLHPPPRSAPGHYPDVGKCGHTISRCTDIPVECWFEGFVTTFHEVPIPKHDQSTRALK